MRRDRCFGRHRSEPLVHSAFLCYMRHTAPKEAASPAFYGDSAGAMRSSFLQIPPGCAALCRMGLLRSIASGLPSTRCLQYRGGVQGVSSANSFRNMAAKIAPPSGCQHWSCRRWSTSAALYTRRRAASATFSRPPASGLRRSGRTSGRRWQKFRHSRSPARPRRNP